MAKPQRILITVIVVAVVVLLGAVAAIVIPIFTHVSGGASGQVAPQGFTSEVTAHGEDDRTRVLRALNPDGSDADLSTLSVGQQLIIQGEGFDASIGIYVGFCAVPETPDVKPGPCLGGIPEDATDETATSDEAGESAWITNNWAWRTFATAGYDDAQAGTFSATLTVPEPTSEALDCSAVECGIFTRADHTAGQDRVQDVYLPFAIIQ